MLKAKISNLTLLLSASEHEDSYSLRLPACGRQNYHSPCSQLSVLTRSVTSSSTAWLLLPCRQLGSRNKWDFCCFPSNEVRIPDQMLELLVSTWRSRIQPLDVFQTWMSLNLTLLLPTVKACWSDTTRERTKIYIRFKETRQKELLDNLVWHLGYCRSLRVTVTPSLERSSSCLTEKITGICWKSFSERHAVLFWSYLEIKISTFLLLIYSIS